MGSVEKVLMDKRARELFNVLRNQIKEMEPTIVELAEEKSISYHAGEFFVEVLPRVGRLLLILAPEFNEVEDVNGIAMDATQKKFFVGSKYDGGVEVNVKDDTDVWQALPLIRQALEFVGR